MPQPLPVSRASSARRISPASPRHVRAPRPALVVLAAAGGILALSLLPGCKPAKADAPPEVPAAAAFAVRLADVGRGPVAHPIRGTGVLRLKSEVDLSFKVGGVVTNVLVEEGAAVKKGQILARVDPTEVEASLRQARESQAKADRDLERVKRLHASGSLPLVELQNAETGASLARAAVDSASFNAQRATIVAPDDGRIDRRALEPGEVVSPGRPVFHFSGRSRGAVVRTGLTDRDVLRVREGDVANVVLDARPGTTYPGRVTQLATVATPGSGTFDVEVRLDALPEGLLSGLTAKIEIEHVETVSAVVPVGSLVDGRGDDAAVFVIDGDHARRVPVKVAFLQGETAALASGLDGTTRVVEAGAAQLENGSRIRLVP